MPSSQPNNQTEQLDKLKSLLACESLHVVAKKGGGNSVVLCVEADANKWAVKSYPPYAPLQRDRLAAELMVYQFLNQHQIPAVPQLKTFSETDRWLVIDWIDGNVPEQYSASDVEQCVQFIRSIHQLNSLPAAKALPLAAEACLSLTILLNQIKQRLARLQSLPEKHADLNAFLENEFSVVLEKCEQRAMNGFLANKIKPDGELSKDKRSLIPADFGFHNSIRDVAGKLYFFDFDYFGWDDPVKLLADILWHPKMQLTSEQKQQFINGVADVYSSDPKFLTRFYYTWPLFGLRWALILLNEFIPAFWQNRQHAGTYDDLAQNQAETQMMQLQRAKAMLKIVQEIECPYETV